MAGGAGAVYENDDDEGGDISDINVTPLVDVTLVLLIIMMVAAPMIANNQSIKVELPKASSGEQTPKAPLVLALRRDGSLYFGDDRVDEAEASRRVKAEYDRDNDTQAIIDADRGVPYGSVMHVIDLVKLQGVTKFALNIDATP
jgi:biopolymer transport protein ExbD